MNQINIIKYIIPFVIFFFATNSTAKSQTNDQEINSLFLELNERISDDSTNPFFYKARGDVYLTLSKYDFAILDFDKAILLFPQYYDAFSSRGIAYHKLGNYINALNDLSYCIINSDNISVEVYFNRGVVLQDMKNYTEAIKNYDKCLEIERKYNSAYYNKGIIFLELRNFQKAVSMFDKNLFLNPNNVLSLTNRGYAKYKLNLYKESIKDLENSLKHDSKNYYALKWIGLCYIQLGNQIKGEKYLEKARNKGVDVSECN